MTLSTGSRLGPYEIVGLLGAGGMGEVYRARDPKLHRDVAIKVLPPAVAGDADRLARFAREAQLLAALNHPHIAQVYGLEEHEHAPALVMELVDGPTLADRLAHGPIPIGDALAIARQIVHALDAAHERGIVHRDLKPANIKLTANDAVKVLDFGLAKALSDEPANLANSPTITSPAMTQAGVILGTAAYMSPEQARGKAVDKRADIWAFGCVVFEMLAGTPAFEGETVTDVLGAVVHKEPDWSKLPAATPAGLRRALHRCLTKDRNQRTRDIADVRFELDEDAPSAEAVTSRRAMRRHLSVAWATATASMLALTAVLAWHFWSGRDSNDNQRVTRFEVPAPPGTTFVSAVTGGFGHTVGRVSPDGRHIAFTARDDKGSVMLWIRPLDSVVATKLAGTEGAGLPFWSPDNGSIGFFTDDKLKRIDIDGKSLRTLCDVVAGRGGSWNADGVILFGRLRGPIARCSANGGTATAVTTLQASTIEHRYPWFLPDGKRFLYFLQGVAMSPRDRNAIGNREVSGVYLGSIEGDANGTRLIEAQSQGIYTRAGYLLFLRESTLFAQRFNVKNAVLEEEPAAVIEQVAMSGAGAFSASDNNILVIRSSRTEAEVSPLAWVDHSGRVERIGAPNVYESPTVSPDGARVATTVLNDNGSDIWLFDSNGRSSRFTFDPAQEHHSPVWSASGTHLAFSSLRSNKWGIYRKRADGVGLEERLLESEHRVAPSSWSPNGELILFTVLDPKTGRDIWVLNVSGLPHASPVLNSAANEGHPQFSPDGQWIAYESNKDGRAEVYVQSFPVGKGIWQVTTNGGLHPRWRADGRTLIYTVGPANLRTLVRVDVTRRGGGFDFVNPQTLFDTGRFRSPDPLPNPYDVSADGKRLLLPRADTNLQGDAASTPLTVILNWPALLQR